MKVSLPLSFEIDVDDEALRELQIDFGSAKANHLKALSRIPELDPEEVKGAAYELYMSLERLWDFLYSRVSFAYPTPNRFKGMICLAAICNLYQIEASVHSAELETRGGASWNVTLRFKDSRGGLLYKSVGISGPFTASSDRASFDAFFTAIIEALREGARILHPSSDLYDDEDIRSASDA